MRKSEKRKKRERKAMRRRESGYNKQKRVTLSEGARVVREEKKKGGV